MGQVLIQKNSGEFHSINTCNAYLGFAARGFEITFAEFPDMMSGETSVEADRITVGAVAFVRKALERLGATVPTLDYPALLQRFLGRRIWQSTLGAVRDTWQPDTPPQFVKPLEVHKAFVGYVIKEYRDLIRTVRLPDDLAVWVSEPVVWLSEWRFHVLNGAVVGAGHYHGDPVRFPDAAIVRGAVAAFATEAPVAYGLDFGVTQDGETKLVEVNDAFALGCYGVDRLTYSQMIEARWRELVGTRAT